MTKEFKKWLEEGSPERRRMGWHDEVLWELNQHANRIEARLHRFFKKALIAIGIIGITSFVALIGFGIVLSKINETRRDFVRDTCVATNKRHDDATNYIIDIANEQTRDAHSDAERAAVQKGLRQYLKLIDLQAPKQNCNELAKVATGQAEPPPPIPAPSHKERP